MFHLFFLSFVHPGSTHLGSGGPSYLRLGPGTCSKPFMFSGPHPRAPPILPLLLVGQQDLLTVPVYTEAVVDAMPDTKAVSGRPGLI